MHVSEHRGSLPAFSHRVKSPPKCGAPSGVLAAVLADVGEVWAVPRVFGCESPMAVDAVWDFGLGLVGCCGHLFETACCLGLGDRSRAFKHDCKILASSRFLQPPGVATRSGTCPFTVVVVT